MGLRIAALLSLLSATLLMAWAPLAPLGGPAPAIPPLSHRFPAPMHAPPGFLVGDRPLAVMIELSGPTALGAPTHAAAAARSQAIDTAQATLQQTLKALGAQVIFRTRLAYNGVAVSIPADRLDQLRSLPGVAGVHVIAPKQRADIAAAPLAGVAAAWSAPAGATGKGIRIGVIDSGIDYTHADFGGPGTPQSYIANDPTRIEPGSFPTAKVVGGFDFAGDNYDAAGVDGSAIPAPDPDPLDCNGHGTHVAGIAAGLGVTADGGGYAGQYTPDLDVSSFRVSPGVAPEAQLYALKVFGCKGSTALMTLAIERALDPNGDGDPSDHLDVLNIAFSSPFGSDDDPDAVALDNAVRAGIVAVVGVGDSGDVFYSTSAPASAQLAIAVGASVDAAHATAQAPADSVASFSSRGPQRGNSALKPDLVAPGVNISSAKARSGVDATTMSGTATAVPQVAGAAALLRQMHRDWSPEQIKAALMDTAAPVRMPNGAPAPPSVGGAGRLDMTDLDALNLLAYADDGPDTVALTYGAPWLASQWTGTRQLRLENHGDTARSVTLSATATVTEPGVLVQLPHGPIALPPRGQAVVPISVTVDPGALNFSPDAATPLKQGDWLRYFIAEHGGYVQVASLGEARVRPANAASVGTVAIYLDDLLLDDSISPGRVEKYRATTPGTHTVRVMRSKSSPQSLLTTQVQLPAAHDYTLIFTGRRDGLGVVVVDETPPAPPPASRALLHFVNANLPASNVGPLDVYLDGVLQVRALPAGQASSYQPVAPGSYTATFFHAGADPAHDKPAAVVRFSAKAGDLLLVGAGQHDEGESCDDDDDGDRTVPLSDDDDDCKLRGFFARSEPRADGEAGERLRVPFQIFPKSASEAHTTVGSTAIAPDGKSFSVGLHNAGARNAPLSASRAGPQTPLASAFELAATSPQLAGASQSLRAVDVQYVGVTSNYAAVQNDVGSSFVYFGIASYGAWSTPNEAEFRVYIDSDLDGTDDYVIVNSSWGAFFGTPNDVFISVLYKISPTGLEALTYSDWGSYPPPTSPSSFDVTPFNTSVMFEGADAFWLGLTNDHSRFRYHIETRSRDAEHFGRVVDRVPAVGTLEYDVAHPAIAPINLVEPILAGRPLFVATDGARITGAVDPATLAARGSQKLLVLYHHNPPATQAELVEISSALLPRGIAGGTYRTYLPLLLSPR